MSHAGGIWRGQGGDGHKNPEPSCFCNFLPLDLFIIIITYSDNSSGKITMLDLLSLVPDKLDESESKYGKKISPAILFNEEELTVSQTSFMGSLVKEYGRKGWYISL